MSINDKHSYTAKRGSGVKWKTITTINCKSCGAEIPPFCSSRNTSTL